VENRLLARCAASPVAPGSSSLPLPQLAKLLSGGVQQVRVVLRALALLQLAKGAGAPSISQVVPLTPLAIW
jgi:hypothetical protein